MMFYVTLILMLLLIPMSFLVGRKQPAAVGTSALRSRATVWHGIAALAVFLAFYEIAYASIQAYVVYGAYNDVSTEYLRYLELALVAFYWLVLLACEVLRRKTLGRLGLVWTLGAVGLAVAVGVALAVVKATQDYYFVYTAGGALGVGLAALLGWTNRLLSFQEGWQRRAVTAVNVLVALTTLAAIVWTVMQGAAALEGQSPDPATLLIVGLVLLAVAAPSLLCLGSVVAAHLKEAGVGE